MSLTLAQVWSLQFQDELNGRIAAAAAKYAKDVLEEPIDTPFYEYRRSLALKMIVSPNVGPFVFRIYLHKGLSEGANASDEEIESAVQDLWNVASGVPEKTK